MARPLRIKTHWFKVEPTRSPADVASALASTVWRTASHRVSNLRQQHFDVEVGAPFVAMMAEILCFLVVVADRIAYRHDQGEWRTAFTTALTLKIADLMSENFDDLLGPSDDGGFRTRFIEHMNLRAGEYAECGYGDDGPSFAMLRYFGELVEAVTASEADQRWAQDQAITVEGPEAVDVLERAMRGLMGVDPKPKRSLVSGD